MILRKVIKIVATRSHILKLKCTKFDFGWGSATDTAGEWGKGWGREEEGNARAASWLLGMDAPGRVYLHFSADAFK